MEKISIEYLVASLLLMDFEFVDVILYTSTMSVISKDEEFSNNFKFIDKDISDVFFDVVGFNGFVFKIKDDCNIPILLKYKLHPNEKLLEYLKNVDFNKVIDMKIKLLGIGDNNLDDCDFLFSDKEKEILNKGKEKEPEKIKINRK